MEYLMAHQIPLSIIPRLLKLFKPTKCWTIKTNCTGDMCCPFWRPGAKAYEINQTMWTDGGEL